MRALERGHIKKQCMKRSALITFSQAWQECGVGFVHLQQLRQRADYAPDAKFARWKALGRLGNTENIIDKLRQPSMKDQCVRAIGVLISPQVASRDRPHGAWTT